MEEIEDDSRERLATKAVVFGLAGAALVLIILLIGYFLSKTDTTTNF